MNGRTPYQCYKEEFTEPMRCIGDKELLSVMRRRTRTVTVTKNGVKFAELDKKDYYCKWIRLKKQAVKHFLNRYHGGIRK